MYLCVACLIKLFNNPPGGPAPLPPPFYSSATFSHIPISFFFSYRDIHYIHTYSYASTLSVLHLHPFPSLACSPAHPPLHRPHISCPSQSTTTLPFSVLGGGGGRGGCVCVEKQTMNRSQNEKRKKMTKEDVVGEEKSGRTTGDQDFAIRR